MLLERLAQYEAGLGEGSLGGVDQQQDAVDDRERTLDLAAEIGVSWSVDEVQLDLASGSGYRTAAFFARIVMPRSRSWSIESITRSGAAWWPAKTPDWRSIASTSVVLP